MSGLVSQVITRVLCFSYIIMFTVGQDLGGRGVDEHNTFVVCSSNTNKNTVGIAIDDGTRKRDVETHNIMWQSFPPFLPI